MTENSEQINFEAALEKLEQIVVKLESGDLDLEEALGLFEEGQQLASLCDRTLEQASLRVEQLSSEGEIVEIEVE